MVSIKELKIKDKSKTLVDIFFNINQSTALVGQSGSGKSLTLKALLGLLPKSLEAKIDIDSEFELIRGDSISFVPQNPFTALSPLTKISKQSFANTNKLKELFGMLNLDWRLYNEYPVNLSGGQLQRVIFAFSLVNEPKLLLLDEPTTALDANLKYELIEILKNLQQKLGFLMLFVTHEINLVKNLCEDMVVLKDGLVVESGKSKEILSNPKASYTKELIDASFANREFRKW